MKKGIIFDIDRTIVDSYEPEMLSLKEAIENVLKKPISPSDLSRLTTLPTQKFYQSLNLDDETIKKIDNEWEITYDKYKIDCFPKIKDVIKELHQEGYQIGILTSRTMSEYHSLDKILEEIKECIQIVVTSDLVLKPKPNKESMEYLCKKLNRNIEEMIYIGDSIIDLEFAKNSGCSFIPAVWENKELKNEKNACFKPEDLLEQIRLES